MNYVGSKRRIAQYILPLMINERKGRTWVEPFVGGANMIDKIIVGKKIGNDIHPYLIVLHKAIQNGWIPPSEISEKEYYDIKENKESYAPELVGFVGFLCSFGGKWQGGYAGSNNKKNYAKQGKTSILKQAKYLKNVDFRCGDYRKLDIPDNSLIYCDPPYCDTEGYYKLSKDFDSQIFWQWCRDKKEEGHIVFISEYNAPEDFECIKEINIKMTLAENSNTTLRTERLFKQKI